MNTPPQRHGAGAGASGDAQVPWVTLEEVGVESVAGKDELEGPAGCHGGYENLGPRAGE